MSNKILVPVDLNDETFCIDALTKGLQEAAHGAELHLLTVVPGFTNSFVASYFSQADHEKAVAQVANKLKSFADNQLPSDVTAILRVYEGSPAEAIVDYVAKQDIALVIMRAHHRSKVGEFLLGSVSARVAERAKCSVLLLKN